MTLKTTHHLLLAIIQCLEPTTMKAPAPPLPLTPRVNTGAEPPPQKILPISLSHADALPIWFYNEGNFVNTALCEVKSEKSLQTLKWLDNKPTHPDDQRVS